MKYLFIYLFILISLVARSQNLVPNYSFENFTTCPSGAQLYNLPPWCGLAGGEDSYNACFNINGPGASGVPETTTGFQYARTGNGFGSVLLKTVGSGTINAERREYLHVPLTNNLQFGKIYCGTIYVNKINDGMYTTDRIGMALTANSFACNQAMPMPQTIAPLNIMPQVANIPGNFITDTLNWVEVSGTFTANGTEAYLTIGNFYNDANTNFITFPPPTTRTVIYLFIDDVSIEEVFPAKAKNDTAIVVGDSIAIGNNSSEAAMYTWQPTAGLSCTNCPNPKASPNITTTYTVTKTQCKSITTDQIMVSISLTSVKEFGMTNDDLRILPNPTNGIITISSKYEMQKIEITNVAGQIFLTEQTTSKEHQLQLQHLAEGIYFARVVYHNGLSTVKKIIVSR